MRVQRLSSEAWALTAGLAGCLAIVLGAKIALLAGYGSNTPFWDQWADLQVVFRPYLKGELRPLDLFAAHNEHRIFLTRLVALGLLIANGYWDSFAQMLLNSAIHVAAIGLFVWMLSRALDTAHILLLALFATLLFVLPFGSGNTLSATQTQFYLLVLLAPLSLWVLCPSAAWSTRWLLGTLLAILSYLSIASGALTLPAFIGLSLIHLAVRQRKGRGEWAGLLLHAALATLILWDVPKVHIQLDVFPKTIAGWADAVAMAASWPITKSSWPLIVRVLVAIVIYIPVLVLALRLLPKSAPISDQRWLVVGLAGWSLLQLAALLYGRGTVLESRYYDILLLAPLVSAAALLHLKSDTVMPRRLVTLFACCWFSALVIGLEQKARSEIPRELTWWREGGDARTQNLTRYLTTGDFAAIAGKPQFHIPTPTAEELRDIASDPLIRSILPPELFSQPANDRVRAFILRRGALLVPIGLALLMVTALLMAGDNRRRDAPG
jgi:hypothetical protein